ncbi:hypothetical protein DFQ11_102173 [Winogradskyella epiphytica]|uniref:DUF1835 domain-containing protein n=1 Tax=Winogradskyella epiphytica TaxID=262005 RepID=A0A2V4X7J3_9FLAO|nr:DUF1835 domain-containing protein [Winogradskyella epiphytica]PYE81599.1 hypothetical protein DFQ11_102173 [Winogradskyella epiphytica]GGW63977.1 hypothetical protein GCM10008085_14940 [Winogradskyella epiphytica]
MAKNCLHITNGSHLTNYLRELNFKEDIFTWQEMLCEGPTIAHINSKAFFYTRVRFLKAYYDIEVDNKEFRTELSMLDNIDEYSEINLWFEYDLFCHINLLGVINLLHQKEIDKPLYLICSGRVKGEKNFKALSELSPEQLKTHYSEKVLLTKEDIDLAIMLWRTYCGKDHNILKPYIVTKSNFKYMGSCLKAHLKRFPDQKSGLGALETNALKIIKENKVKSENHLLGYCLNYQGYYGYSDMQLARMIKSLSIFYDISEEGLSLNRKGHEALLKQHNFAAEINNHMDYGGVKRLDYQFSEEQNKLIKTVPNAN